ncbi:MAG: 2-C-methyl-D-erythritol 4-phosphate cytidylyltransferase [Candidatus Margulisiibacteriota bacterium]|jgi:2-C-methyl-D-erythritol 4-phosphate cytidylyltransferase
MKKIAIIVAGGRGKRMGQDKQFLPIAGRPMLGWTAAAFDKAKIIDGIILVVARHNLAKARKIRSKKIIAVVASGPERQDSVQNGLKALPESAEIVLIHDGARPAVSEAIISASVKAAQRHGAAVVGVPVKDTIKRVLPPLSSGHLPLIKGENERGFVKATLDRRELWAAQTPQTFQASLILNAYAKIRGLCTDDAMVVELAGLPVVMVMGSYQNIKVTTPEDLDYIAKVLKRR